MNVALWIVAGVLSAGFLASGATNLSKPKDKLVAAGNGWVEDYSAGMVKTIGTLEILAAVGLILPAAVDIAPVMVAVAAAGLVALMIGAAITHGRRQETRSVVINIVLLAMAVFVAWGRFGPHSF
ncbi:DoxX family protein [Streptomyces sp. NPDC049040]|uniref:DoxX family protein n=1 Tax=Streptomyces sp. NPDC049040 TaxID=3365593 RepID=UPI00371A1C30